MKKLLFVMFFTMFPVLAHGATTYYVAQTGNASDSNSCAQAQSESTPKRTINSGIGCLFAGDTLIVKPGTYAEIVKPEDHHLNYRSGSPGAPITVRSEIRRVNDDHTVNAGAAKIIPPGSPPGPKGGTDLAGVDNQAYWTFDGCVMDCTGFWAGRFFQDMHDTNPSNNIRLVNMELHGGLDNNDGSNNTGISASAGLPDTPGASGSSFWYVGNNLIHHLGEGAVAGQNF